MARLLPAMMTAALLGACSRSVEPMQVHGVQVRDSQFRVVHALTSEAELQRFAQLWDRRVKTSQTSAQVPDATFEYKLDIAANRGGGRWLYSLNGTLVKLDPLAQPVFQLPDPGAFNTLIGLSPQ